MAESNVVSLHPSAAQSHENEPVSIRDMLDGLDLLSNGFVPSDTDIRQFYEDEIEDELFNKRQDELYGADDDEAPTKWRAFLNVFRRNQSA